MTEIWIGIAVVVMGLLGFVLSLTVTRKERRRTIGYVRRDACGFQCCGDRYDS
jgi:hypothetical protein